MVGPRDRTGGVLHLAEPGRGPPAARAHRLGRRAVARSCWRSRRSRRPTRPARRSSSTRSTPASAGQWRTSSAARLQRLADGFQVLCITHLPQIAAHGGDALPASTSACAQGRTVTSRRAARRDRARGRTGADDRRRTSSRQPSGPAPREMLQARQAGAKGETKAKGESESPARAKGRHGAEIPHRNVRLPDERPRLGAHGRPARPGRLRADRRRRATPTSIVINTCSVREHAEEKLYTRLGEIRAAGARGRARGRSSRSPAASRSRKATRFSERSSAVDVIIGTQNIRRLPMLVDDAVERPDAAGRPSTSTRWTTCRSRWGSRARSDPVEGVRHHHRGLQRVLRLLRRAVHARPRADAAGRRHPRRGARHAAATGAREIQLLGQIVNHYQAPDDPACDFAGTARAAERGRGARADPLREPASAARHAANDRGDARPPEGLPAPAPAGAVRLDARPVRDAAAAHAGGLPGARRSRSATAMPDIALSTDMIVGFPGETGRRLRRDALADRAVRYHSMFSFKYSPRPNTLALEAAAGRRRRRTRRRGASWRCRRCSGRFRAGCTSRRSGASNRSWWTPASRRRDWELSGRTSGNTVVNFTGDGTSIGKLVPVRITERESEQPAGRDRGARARAGLTIMRRAHSVAGARSRCRSR